jgi:hypothetical protein
MVEGVAEYREPKQEPYRIFIGEEAIKNMDPTFQGKPVYVHHVDQVDLPNLQEEADGYVTESFYNPNDGKHWVKFIVVSDKGHQAIRNGWKLSNAYVAKNTKAGGRWHGVDYLKEVTSGEYEHLAIVPDPRYAESDILTPEEFKAYNEEKQVELKRLANSKNEGAPKMKLSFFRKSKVENSSDIEGMSVKLPKSGREVELTTLINEADDAEQKKSEPQMCNGDHCVQVGDEKMTVNELVEKHLALKDSMKKNDAEDGDSDTQENEDDKSDDDKKKENEDDKEGADKKENEDQQSKAVDEEKKKNALAETKKKKQENFESLKNAHNTAPATSVVETSMDMVARGKAKYGSK